MAKEDLIESEGVVTDVLPDGRFRVRLETGHEIVAYTAGRMRKHRIRTLAGDRVTVEMTPYDLEKAASSSATRKNARLPRRPGRPPDHIITSAGVKLNASPPSPSSPYPVPTSSLPPPQ